MKLLLFRHGATDWSLAGRHTGRTNLELNDLGRKQALRARRNLERVSPNDLHGARIFSSPLSRAVETAAIVLGRGRDVVLADELLEFDYGDFEGLTPEQIQQQAPGWSIWSDGCPGGERVSDVGRRIDTFLRMVERVEEPVIVFAHGHVLRILAARAVGLKAQEGSIFTLGTASLSIIEDVRGHRVVRLWNLEAD